MADPKGKTSTGIEQNLAGLLCYVAWWISGIIFLILEKDNQFIRFHAIQSIITFGAISIIEIILPYIPVIGGVLAWIVWVISIILWIVLMVKAYQGQKFKLPIAGDIAERSSKPAKQ